jgi:hypothetical protein
MIKRLIMPQKFSLCLILSFQHSKIPLKANSLQLKKIKLKFGLKRFKNNKRI